MPQAMKIPDAKAQVDKEWEKIEKLPACGIWTKWRARENEVHFATMMDICHLKNAELQRKHQKYKGPVVFRGDIEKDDSGAYAAREIDVTARVPTVQDKQPTKYQPTPK